MTENLFDILIPGLHFKTFSKASFGPVGTVGV